MGTPFLIFPPDVVASQLGPA